MSARSQQVHEDEFLVIHPGMAHLDNVRGCHRSTRAVNYFPLVWVPLRVRSASHRPHRKKCSFKNKQKKMKGKDVRRKQHWRS